MNSVGNHCVCNCCDETKKMLADLTDRLERLEQRELNGKNATGIQPKFVDHTKVEMSSPDRGFTSVVAEHVGVVGLKETITWKHRPLKIIWAFLMIVGAGATVYYIVQNTIDYLGDNTATRVSFQQLSEYPFPPFVVCPPWPINMNDALSTTGLPFDTLNYSLAWIFSQEDDNDEVAYGVTEGISFTRYLKKNNYTGSTYNYYFLNISTSAVDANETEYTNHTLTYDCSGCDKSQTQGSKLLYVPWLCYTFKLSPMTNIDYTSQPSLILVNHDDTGGLLTHKSAHWMFDILSNIGQDGPHIRLDPGAYVATINTQSFKMLEGQKCQQNGPTNAEDGDPLESCRQSCYSNSTNTFFVEYLKLADLNGTGSVNENGSDLMNVTNVEQNSNEQLVDKNNTALVNVTNILVDGNETELVNVTEDVEEYSKAERSLYDQWMNITERSEAKADMMVTGGMFKECLESCKPACNSRVYTVSIMRQESYQYKNTNKSDIYLTFDHLAWRRGYVLAYEEVDTMTFSDFISNVGGTFGLFLGCTILTIAQFILSFCHYICENKHRSSE